MCVLLWKMHGLVRFRTGCGSSWNPDLGEKLCVCEVGLFFVEISGLLMYIGINGFRRIFVLFRAQSLSSAKLKIFHLLRINYLCDRKSIKNNYLIYARMRIEKSFKTSVVYLQILIFCFLVWFQIWFLIVNSVPSWILLLWFIYCIIFTRKRWYNY